MIPLGVLASARVAAGGGGSLVGTPVGSASSTTVGATQTFTSVPIGDTSSGRTIIVCAGGYGAGNRTISQVTINGAVAALDVINPSNWFPCGVARLAVPAGTTAEIVVTFSGSVSTAAVTVYSLPTSVAVVGTLASIGTSPVSGVLTSTTAGWTVAMSTKGDNYNMVWTGLAEDYDFQVGSDRYGSASSQTSAGNLTITQTSAGNSGLAAVAYATA